MFHLLGFADRQYHREDGVQENWRFLGLMSFSDPMQENAMTAIEKCHLAGVRVSIDGLKYLKMKLCCFFSLRSFSFRTIIL